jgi:hypothetical protein
VPGVARAHCLAPGSIPATSGDVPPGQVVVLVAPALSETEDRPTPADLVLGPELRAAVQNHLNGRRVLGATLDVRSPQYAQVTVSVTLRVADRSDPFVVEQVQRTAEAALYYYLSPYTGGPDGKGWPIGRDFHVSEIYARLQRIAGVEYVEDVQVTTHNPDAPGGLVAVAPRLAMERDMLLCSGVHTVEVV